jgi:hypothetical protein
MIEPTKLDDDTYRVMLLNLLAVIHRDGGRHTQKVGVEVSYKHAMRMSAILISDLPTWTAS